MGHNFQSDLDELLRFKDNQKQKVGQKPSNMQQKDEEEKSLTSEEKRLIQKQ